jgi:hypothetical protein
MAVSGCIASLTMLPMAVIKLFDSPWHLVAAIVIFVSLGVCEITDTIVQHKVGARAVLNVWNYIFSIGGLVCFVGWFVVGSYSQWIAATMPFLYFMPWPCQALAYRQQHDSTSETPGDVETVGAPASVVSQ